MKFYRNSKRCITLFMLTDWVNDVINEVKIFVQWNFEIIFFVSMYCFHRKCMDVVKPQTSKGIGKVCLFTGSGPYKKKTKECIQVRLGSLAL